MDSYLLKSEKTGIEAMLASIPTTSKLFSKIAPHESTDPKLETYLTKDLIKNFSFEEALYCATTEPFLKGKNFDQYFIKSKSSQEFGEQSIYRLKEKITLNILDKIILLDGHHRFSVINKYFIDKKNEVPIIFIYFEDLSIGDHYFFGNEEGGSEGWFSPASNAGYREADDTEDYDLVRVLTSDSPPRNLYYKHTEKQTKTRFDVRDEILSSPGFKFKPSKPPLFIKGHSGADMNQYDICFAAKAPTKQELLSGEVFPTKSTWITPKFNPDLYKEYLN